MRHVFPFGTPKLDFIVVGAQKAGTTSLWRYLEDHPRLAMPQDKEASFFSEPAYPHELRSYLRAVFKEAPRNRLLGKVTPAYLTGTPGISVPTIAQRIGESVPQARLVALLRDPVERAYSAYRMWVDLGEEDRPFAEAIDRLLEPPAIERARGGPTIRDSYVVSGEYGWMLSAYAEHFPADQLHVEFTADLDRAPRDVVARVCRFIGVEPHEPARLGERFNPTGRPRVSARAENELKEYLDRNVWPRVKYPEQHRHQFQMWFLYWNAEPGPPAPAPPIEEDVAARLREHYAEDARLLEEVIGVRPPWAGDAIRHPYDRGSR